ncbi:MAG: NAD(P)-binding domain-containing protein, partial [Geminicoccaceae bacterium]|nr:NAD(P)-binding domain-containing protein [Geminicoccaceae bacterium]
MTARSIGFIGLGKMGRPMAGHLARAGHRLVVADRQEGLAAGVAQALGAMPAATPADVAGKVELLILMLPDGRVVRDVLLDDPDGAVGGL